MSLVLGGFYDKASAQSMSLSTTADEGGSSQSAPKKTKKTPSSAATTEDGSEPKARQTTTAPTGSSPSAAKKRPSSAATTEDRPEPKARQTTTAPTGSSPSAAKKTKKTPPPAASTQDRSEPKARQTTTGTEPTGTTARANSSQSEARVSSAAVQNSSPAATSDGSLVSITQAAVPPARLGLAGNFAILAGSTVTNTGPTTITGDVGLHPGSAVTGFPPCTPPNCVTLTGTLHATDGVALPAKNTLVTAYHNLLAETTRCTDVGVELGGSRLIPGVYCSPTFGLTGTLILDALGDPDAEFIFLTGAGGSTLITSVGSSVSLIGGAQACNVYWQVASSATIGVGTAFVGNVLALESISMQTGATLQGRALARTSAVTLDTNTITRADCETVVPPDGGGGGPGGVTPPGGGGPGGVTPLGGGGPGGGGPGGGPGGVTSPTTGDTTGRAQLALTGVGLRSPLARTDGALSTLSRITRSSREPGLGGQAGRAARNFPSPGRLSSGSSS